VTAAADLPPSIGRVPGPVGGALVVTEHILLWYRRNWRGTAVSSILQPLLFLLAFGVGFGGLAGEAGLAAVTGGVPYLDWLAPGLLVASAVQNGTDESTYSVLSGFRWQRVYHAMTAGPVSPPQVAFGHLLWVAAKIAGVGIVFIVVAALLGGVRSPGIVVALLAAVLAGVAMAAPVTAFAATVDNEGFAFQALFRLVLLPMTLFSGTFFPVDRLPAGMRPLVWLSPLWHGVELARAAALDRWQPLAALGHVAFLVALAVLGAALAARLFTRRLRT
jgi:lipooligosaccharide transport system permease protein